LVAVPLLATWHIFAIAAGAEPASSVAAPADFDARKSAPGVIRWFDFDSASQLGRGDRANVGILPGTSTSPVIDTNVKASGAGSLRFDIPSRSSSNAAGAWFANFSSDLRTQFGENTEFFIQWRQRFNRAFIDTFFVESAANPERPQQGIKQAIITTGDTPSKVYHTCETTEVVVQSYYQYRFPIVYNSCTGSGSHGGFAGLYEKGPSYDFQLQNARPGSCTYLQAGKLGATVKAPAGCFNWVADEWLTFQIGIKLGPRDNANNDFLESRVRLWGAREGQPSQLLVDWKPGVPGYFPLAAGPLSENQKFGKIWLLPYMTTKEAAQVHGLAQTWYDDLIISTKQIPDPK